MALVFPREALRTIVVTLSGFPKANIVYPTEPVPFLAPVGGVITGLITLNLTSREALGSDETRLSYDEPTNTQTETIGGPRSVTCSIRVESFNQRVFADDVLEQIRMRLNFPSQLAALRASNLSYQDVSGITPIPNYSVDDRAISAASMDLMLGWVASSEPDVQRGFIEKVSSDEHPDPATAPAVDLQFTRR